MPSKIIPQQLGGNYYTKFFFPKRTKMRLFFFKNLAKFRGFISNILAVFYDRKWVRCLNFLPSVPSSFKKCEWKKNLWHLPIG